MIDSFDSIHSLLIQALLGRLQQNKEYGIQYEDSRVTTPISRPNTLTNQQSISSVDINHTKMKRHNSKTRVLAETFESYKNLRDLRAVIYYLASSRVVPIVVVYSRGKDGRHMRDPTSKNDTRIPSLLLSCMISSITS